MARKSARKRIIAAVQGEINKYFRGLSVSQVEAKGMDASKHPQYEAHLTYASRVNDPSLQTMLNRLRSMERQHTFSFGGVTYFLGDPNDETAFNLDPGMGGLRIRVTSRPNFQFTTGAVDADHTPNSFSFTDVTGAVQGTTVESNSITVQGINKDAPISVANGEYRIGTGPWRTAASTVRKGQQVRVRGIAASAASTGVNVVLTIGGVSDTFTVTTAA